VDIIDLKNNNIIFGDDTAAQNVFVYHEGDNAYTANAAGEILSHMHQNGKDVKIGRAGVVYLLHNSLIPTPASAYEDVYVLGAGDRLEFDKQNLHAAPRYSCDFPYHAHKSTGRSVPSTKTLFDLLCASVEKTARQGDCALMLSSGKDSTAIALALREVGYEKKVQAYTYGDDEEESLWAKEACDKLGLKHKTVLLPKSQAAVRESLLHYFTHSSHPCCDPALIPYAYMMYLENIKNMNVMDGSHNTVYMGYTQSKKYARINGYYRIFGGGFKHTKALRQLMPFYFKANKLFSSVPEVNLLYKHLHLRDKETQKFFPHDTDTYQFWLDWYQENEDMDVPGNKTVLHAQNFSYTSATIKKQTATEHMGSRAVLPWADQDIIDYYFNLPEEHKYDQKNCTSKIILRAMMKEYMDFDFKKIGKKIFYFDAQKFLLENKDFVREEILGCSLWNGNIEEEFKKYMDIVARVPRAGNALVDLFLVSGWHNHCKFLKGS